MEAQILDVSSRAADKFIGTYYKLYDRQRHLIKQLYKETSILVWNGNPVSGSNAIFDLHLAFPATEHDVLAYDCQPIVSSDRSDLLLAVSGTVQYGDEKQKKAFSQTFILKQDTTSDSSNYYIGSDVFRFV